MSILFVRKRDLLAVGALIMVAAAMLGIGVMTTKTVMQGHLINDAASAALRWSTLLEQRNDDDVRSMLRSRSATTHVDRVNWNARQMGDIIAYELYDRDGQLFFSSGRSDWLPSEDARPLFNSPITQANNAAGDPTIRLHEKADCNIASSYASVIVPYNLANDYAGSLVVYVDQTDHALSLSKSFGAIATATAILLLIVLGAAAYVVITKSRERGHAEARASYLAEHDELTGLPNRQAFKRRVHAALDKEPGGSPIAILFIDISRFKQINEAFGHPVGDTILCRVAERLQANIATDDFAARTGSNEFAIALTSATTPKKVATVVNILRRALKRPYRAEGEDITCSYSIGAALAPTDSDNQEGLSRRANMALDRAKAEGADSFKFFEVGMDVAFQRRREREQDMRNAIKNEQFKLQFQPQVCTRTKKICGQEALLRWDHPLHGSISPAYFIPLAEETELIIPIGEWVLRRACEEAVKWAEPINVAVNLSPVQFDGTLADVVSRILDETGLDPARLELEITEYMLISDTETVVDELEKLRSLGVAIAMDDFGTGYSSLSYISSFPFNKIKIDKAFIHAMTKDDALNAIVKCIIAMGQSLGVTITAEGVETEEQAALLRRYGCHQIQGFLFGRPVDPEACAELIATSPTLAAAKTGTAKKKSKAA